MNIKQPKVKNLSNNEGRYPLWFLSCKCKGCRKLKEALNLKVTEDENIDEIDNEVEDENENIDKDKNEEQAKEESSSGAGFRIDW